MTWFGVLAVGAALVLAALAYWRAGRALARAEALNGSYWDLKLQHQQGQRDVRAALQQLSSGVRGESTEALAGPQSATAAAHPPGASFVPLASLKTGSGSEPS